MASTLHDSSKNILLDYPTVQCPKYRFLRELGRGGFGEVVLALEIATHQSCAIKIVKIRTENQIKFIRAEVLNHRRLNHFHVIGFREVFAADDAICLVLEYADNRTLEDLLRAGGTPLSEITARWFFQQIIVALDYSHTMKVVSLTMCMQFS